MMLDKKQIEEKLKNIFMLACSPINIFDNNYKLDLEILGDELGFRSRHLLFIFYAIESDFQMRIPEQVIID